MKVPEKVKRRLESIKDDKEKGASELVIEVIEVFREYILLDESLEKEKIDELVKIVSQIRPSMFPLSNHAKRLGKLLCNRKKSEALKVISYYIEEVKEKKEKIIKNAGFLKDSSIITCSYSSIVKGFIEKFIDKLKKVVVCESKLGNISYGKKYLKIHSPKIVVIADDEIDNFSDADCGIIGADGVTSEGNIINGKPSLKMCSRLNNLRKPVWVITGLDKFGNNCQILEEEFDLIPANLIKGFITECGTLGFEKFCSIASSIYR